MKRGVFEIWDWPSVLTVVCDWFTAEEQRTRKEPPRLPSTPLGSARGPGKDEDEDELGVGV